MSVRSSVMKKLVMLLTVFALVPATGASAAEAIQWRFFSYVSVADFHSHMNKAMAEDITKATGGRLVITHYGAGELPYKSGDVIKAVASNQIQMGQVGAGLVAGDAPELDVFSLPFLCTNFKEFAAAIAVIGDIPDRVLNDKFKVRVLMNWPIPGQNIWSTQKVERVSDLKGKKIRTWNLLQVAMLQKLGGIPTTLDPSEVVTALQRKIIDGAITSALSANDWKAYDLIKYGFILNFTMAHQLTLCNQKALEDLPPDLRAIMQNKITEWTPKYFAGAEAADQAAMNNMAAHGVTMSFPAAEDLTKTRDLLRPMWEEWANKNGPVAQELLRKVAAATR